MFEDDMKENVPGCPKTYDRNHEICKDCSLAGDCRRGRLEDLAMDPEQMGKIIAIAQEEAEKIRSKKIEKELKANIDQTMGVATLPTAHGYIRSPFEPIDPNKSMDKFMELLLTFGTKMKATFGGSEWKKVIPLFEIFLKNPPYLYQDFVPPPPPTPVSEPPPPTPEEVEEEILKINNPKDCYSCAMGLFAYRPAGRFPAGEKIIRKSPEFACKYARDVLKKPWPEAEEVIAINPEWVYEYTGVLHGRFHAGEMAIASSPEFAYKYARTVLGKRWNMIDGQTCPALVFAVAVEDVILADPVWGPEYRDYFQMKT